MSITTLKRLTLYGRAGQKDAVLEGLQELGCLHLLSLRPAGDGHGEAPSPQPRETYDALRHLLDSPLKRRPVAEDETFDGRRVVELALANRQRLRELRDRLEEVRHRIQEVEAWGDFAVPPPDDLAGLRLWFYIVPLRQLPRLEAGGLTWQVVRRDHRRAHVVVIAAREPAADAVAGERVALGPQSLSDLRRAEEAALTEVEERLAERWTLTRWIELLRRDLAGAENRAALDFAASQTLDAGEIFAVQGWVPSGRSGEARRLAARHDLACIATDPVPSDSPPVLLANRGPVATGEDLVAFFQLPGYRDWDPSAVVFVSFALFFAMILADAGYAAILGLGLVFAWTRLGRSATGRRMRQLAGAIVAASVAYGVLVGSYFGTVPAPGSPLARLRLLDINDFDSMMRLTVIVGAAHVVLANGMAAWNRRGSAAALASLGWITVIGGGLALVLGRPGDALRTAGPWVAGAGGAAVVLFSSTRRLGRPLDLLWRLLDGLKAATGLTTAVGDVLSYLRLFALGLSSASLAVTFNGLAVRAIAEVPGIGLLLGLGILGLGHLLNVLLAVMSGVVHGMRLNLIEFYRWGIAGEGNPFRAFRKKET